MAKFSFEDVLKQENKFDDGIKGKKILFYGENDTGKTYQATHFPKPLLLMTESGGSAVNCPKVSIPSFSYFKSVVGDVTKNVEQYRDSLQTIIIDTAENLVDLSERSVCNEFGVRDLSEITGKQNGYKIARSDFSILHNKKTKNSYVI